MSEDRLKLSNQLCFPIYAVSRLIIREYQPQLDRLGITYPQYLVMLVLWEKDNLSVNDIAKKLILNTNTLTPLLKRMQTQKLLERKRSEQDERKVIISLTEKGIAMKEDAKLIPASLIEKLNEGSLSLEQLIEMRSNLNALIDLLNG
ncbi:MarR family winged helix-turn-helix transcriptional regulator [Saccharicrinis aurantiacus]|uniref:MarR family winged helix-turn-helix transcriptional regulator n=1 Tax=Saccharicrinis aurantiacus TaxID=1849719 RepID=UPI00094FAA9F|nr:MarR family transcriptional regulator [Saccharicrinis aurantiacus]